MTEMRLVVAGAAGRMGSTLVRTIVSTPGISLAGALERYGAPEIGADGGPLHGDLVAPQHFRCLVCIPGAADVLHEGRVVDV